MPDSLLLIDDDHNLLMGLKDFFKKSGYVVFAASNGQQALEHIRAQNPDIVLCDVMMPPPNGFEIKRILNEDINLSKIPFVFLTARSTKANIVEGMTNHGADDYITKPVDPDILLARIKNIIRRNKLTLNKAKSFQEGEALSGIDTFSKKLEVLNNIFALQSSDDQLDKDLRRAVELFAEFYQPKVIEFWEKDENSNRYEFTSGFIIEYAQQGIELLELAIPTIYDPALMSEASQPYYSPPLQMEFARKFSIKIFNSTYHDEIIDPVYIQAFLNQISIFLQRKDTLKLIAQLEKSNVNHVIGTLKGLSKAQELRDHDTNDHGERVADLTILFASQLDVQNNDLNYIYLGAFFHDIGKIGIPDSILYKKGRLSEDEMVLIKQHPIYGYELLSKFDHLTQACNIPLYHHERWDGLGYPYGLKETEIPFDARIFSIVDVWDAMIHDRLYRPAIPKEEVISYLQQESGKSFQPELVYTFLRLIQTGVIR